MSQFTKDPNARLDYTWDWSSWLASGETITAHQVILPTGITLDLSTADASTVTAWLLGGTAATKYRIICRVTTSANRIDDRSITIICADR